MIYIISGTILNQFGFNKFNTEQKYRSAIYNIIIITSLLQSTAVRLPPYRVGFAHCHHAGAAGW